ncbi:uncharacterized protein BP5553_07596 [Venustampulla echinocandica]|uniref:AB hydrolase-1 domain-containing protein n=1 Tax=Venustampulla echinocandica TaxID=2656787 RepID=A0A370TGZ4_9HELO|nr:uncharacterized protein BP5553_07596 [Venustampulla echinocandica]RDL34468.1 hypothetical protein BP5553_07596 [Venustampulla echinocandica]
MARVSNLRWLPLLLLSALCLFSNATPLATRQPMCTDFTIPVTIHAQNQDLSVVTAPTFNITVDGTFNIFARYCEPQVNLPYHGDILQFLVHGLTYTNKYWTADGWDRNSWVSWASVSGYPTLAIDCLGSGNSSHPDPNLVVQMQAQVETLHRILTLIRSTNSPLPRRYNKIIYAGHSYGSLLGNALVTKYPTDVNVLVLTGYSSSLVTSINATLLPAQITNPSKFGSLPPEYLQFADKEGFRDTFYHVNDYSEDIFELDYSLQGTMATGEVATITQGLVVASGFTGPVYVVTGKYDTLFCNSGGAVDCGTNTAGFLPNTRQLFPAANPFDVAVLDNAGHCWLMHYAGIIGVVKVMGWLTTVGY